MNVFAYGLLLVTATGLALSKFSATAPAVPPNILLILTDDQGWGDLKSHGNPYLQTPHLDEFARQSTQFDRFYVSPLCAPTRASLLTGRYHLRTGTISVTHSLEMMRADETTLAELAKQNGYATGCFGKWHNGEHYPNNPPGQGFDEFLGFCAGHWNNYFDTQLETTSGEFTKTNGYITDVLTDRAIQFIDKNKNKPFFCYVPFNAPHSPYQVPDRYFDTYKAKVLDDELAAIYGMVQNIDDNIAKLLNALKERGLDENTIVIFMTDNGPQTHRYNGQMRGIKGQVDEGGNRVPCWVRWPGKIVANRVIKTSAAHIDWLPTLADFAGWSYAHLPVDGLSLAVMLRGGADTLPNRSLFTHVGHESPPKPTPGSVRNGPYRLVMREKENPKPALYNVEKDPFQQHDIAADSPVVTQRLLDAYTAWFKAVLVDNKAFARIAPVGYPQAPRVELQAPESQFTGHIRFYQGEGWANDWLRDWSGAGDTIAWQVAVKHPSPIRFRSNTPARQPPPEQR